MSTLTTSASILVRRPREAVFDALVNAEAMSRYWFTRRDEGLAEGEPCTWYLGSGDDAPAFEVLVRELTPPERLVIDWDVGRTMVWSLEDVEGDTRLGVRESGFLGSPDERVAAALDSAGGFNQVVVALKVWLESGVAINVVESHG